MFFKIERLYIDSRILSLPLKISGSGPECDSKHQPTPKEHEKSSRAGKQIVHQAGTFCFLSTLISIFKISQQDPFQFWINSF